MLFRETVAVYCENHTEPTNTLCGQNAQVLKGKILKSVSGIYFTCNSTPINKTFSFCFYIKQSFHWARIVTDLFNALPGNSFVNKVQHATVDEAVLSMSSAPCQVRITDLRTRSLTGDMCFLCGLRHATIEGLCFLCVNKRFWWVQVGIYRVFISQRDRKTSVR
jgi:hypothetical protein